MRNRNSLRSRAPGGATSMAVATALLTLGALGVGACAPAPATARGSTAPAAAPPPLAYTKVMTGVADLAAAEAKVTAALKAQGFGIITRIDVQAVVKAKLGKDVRPYVILGACNPGFAHQALEIAPQVGLLLPCKVIVYQRADGAIVVSIARPQTMFTLIRDPRLADIAAQVDGRFQKAFEAL